jgi:hypothetical protein
MCQVSPELKSRSLLAAQRGAGQAPQAGKIYRIGFPVGAAFSSPSVQIQPFNQSLREQGWIEG